MEPCETQINSCDLAPQSVSDQVVLRAEGLRKSFGSQQVLDSVSVELHRGEIVLLRGENGSGKTTLLNILTGNLEPDRGTISLFLNSVEEHFVFPKPWWREMNPMDHFTPERVAWEGVGRTWQDIRLFRNLSLADNIAVGIPRQVGENPVSALVRSSLVRRQQRRIASQCKKALDRLQLGGRETSSADKISLGQAKRVAIIRAIEAGAKILFLDEPLSGLDVAGAREVSNMLAHLVREKGVTLVIVEHTFNIRHMLDFADTVWTLRQGRIHTEGPSSMLRNMVCDEARDVRGWISKIADPGKKVGHQALLGGAVLSLFEPDGSLLGDRFLEVRNLLVLKGKRFLFGSSETAGTCGELSFVLRRGQIGVLQAPNGWGKTTLLEAIAGLLPVYSGSIDLSGRGLIGTTPWQRRSVGVSLMQSRTTLFPTLSVREALRLAGVSSQVAEQDQVRSFADKQISDLSGGERQRVAIASLPGKSVSMLLLDEPFSSLDNTGVALVSDLVRSVAREGAVLLAVPFEIKEQT